MRYSLINRVRGTLIGNLIGQSLAAKESGETYFCKTAVWGIQSLVVRGRFDLDEWNKLQLQNWDSELSNDLLLLNLISSTLPITIFFHENGIKLKETLLSAIKIHDNPLLRDAVLTVCYLVAQSLNENINQNSLVSGINAFLGETTSDIPKKLQLVNNLIIENAGLAELQNYLDKENNISNLIAVAFYCFVTSREDFRLTCVRVAAVDKHKSQVCGAIVGAISGAYNGMTGIPITWHLGLDEAKLAQWELTNFSQMVKLADALVAVWSGAYHLLPQPIGIKEDYIDLISPNEAITAPYVMRLR